MLQRVFRALAESCIVSWKTCEEWSMYVLYFEQFVLKTNR